MACAGYRHVMSARLRRRNALVAFARAFKPGTPGVGRRLAALPRMIKASIKGEYDGLGRLALMALAGLYVLSPIDLVPEAIFYVFGLIDDAFVVTWLTGAVLGETERFLEWEAANGRGPRKVVKVVQTRRAGKATVVKRQR
jgi:uncharacterized membrane protein YkvA (DUF1232 family)